jgi:uncharacterized protein
MPEYLAPGVYVEETSFRQKTIEGVSTSTAGFVGPARFGPTAGEPELLTSYFDFERIYGGIDPLSFQDESGESPNDLAHAVRGFFENGGRRLYVSRTYTAGSGDGHASYVIGQEIAGSVPGTGVTVRARHPGAAGEVVVTFRVRAGENILVEGSNGDPSTVSGASPYDTVLVTGPTAGAELYWLEPHLDVGNQRETFRLRRPGDAAATAPSVDSQSGVSVHVLTVTVTVGSLGRFMEERTWDDLSPDPRHRRDPLAAEFAAEPTRRVTELHTPIVIGPAPLDLDPDPLTDGVTVLEALLDEVVVALSPVDTVADLLQERLVPEGSSPPQPVEFQVELEEGSDGERPVPDSYAGRTNQHNLKSGLLALEDLEDISIVAAPGSTRGGLADRVAESASIQQSLLAHCAHMRYRIAVLDPPDDALVGEVRRYRATMDSTHAALYYPWVTVLDPFTRQEMNTPPSGFVAGIYARNDVERGVHKAPANEVVRLAIGLEHLLNRAQQDVLNPAGVNCLRSFEGRGLRVWGARCITSDPEWRYVSLRRYFAFLERSIDVGTQWAVFEPNGSGLWSRVRRTVEDFLFNEWSSGRLLGDAPEEAYFVKCDRTTMTQSDLDNGRLICLIGVAPLRPAEFVIFRIGQKTLESRA